MKDEIKIGYNKKELLNDFYIEDLKNLLKTNSTIPTHTPKKFVDCFWLYYDGATTYELYVYINNEWKKAALS
jgi:hypothetical protein